MRIAERLQSFDQSDVVHQPIPRVLSRPVSGPGVATGIAFGALTMLPSMLPKSVLTQGVVLGITLMLGYALGVAWQWAWEFLELPGPRGGAWDFIVKVSYLALVAMLTVNLWRHVGWQNSLRREFGMSQIGPTIWGFTLPLALVVASGILVIGRSLRKVFHALVRWFDRHMPRRLALLLGGLAFFILLWGVWSQVLVDGFFAGANQISAPVDDSTDEGIAAPGSPLRSGSPDSLIPWETLGRQGRSFVAGGPTVDDLNAFHGAGAMESIRVYAGLKSGQTVQDRADLVLDELIRTGAFERAVLVVATTTGTGLIDPHAMDALELVTNGDVAIAGVQYSYLPSAVSLLADVDEVRETAQVVFEHIHEYWSQLPDAARPDIYLYGLSLGSLGVESILTSIDIINEPIDGALLVGPPFVNDLRNRLVLDRDPDSTPARPVYEGGSTVRFMDESGIAGPPGEWGDTRVLYLQHASDPVVFFSPDLLLDRPEWLTGENRGPEIYDGFHWIPFVTVWQVLTDMAVANSVPEGFGHVYTRQAHVEAWAAVLQPAGWSAVDTARLQQHLTDQGL